MDLAWTGNPIRI
ncbi:hypothetical protein F383_12772 [Gossypium arboreum]|uniref:Uncharacterized protein n=1 Tax=Gossypium arboreum TaxID=29729 RepID=A0A0B0MGM6_GOSAR|nr:hypothetical protein F383_38725 [Gossypium arboreum]KHG11426.1 hypothetical protein F383_14786 [Gossypium arboreum]KHG27216.1 hypothetical protein F383_12772 [Gossypium arboreum]